MTDEDAVLEATRDAIMKEYADGTLRVAILIEPRDKQRFMRLLPDIGTRIAIARLIEEHERPQVAEAQTRPPAPPVQRSPASPKKGPYGMLAEQLRLHADWMGNPKVWALFGSDADYCNWLQGQPCAYCKQEPQWVMDTYHGSECAHVRRIANGAGERIKPQFSAIPLCRKDHQSQHDNGESAVGGEQWFDRQRMKHIHTWLWIAMKERFEVASMSWLQPERLLAYAQEAGVEKYLPECYREV